MVAFAPGGQTCATHGSLDRGPAVRPYVGMACTNVPDRVRADRPALRMTSCAISRPSAP